MRNLVSAVGVAALVATFIVFVGGIAQAAPQGLGLIATNGGVELKCRGDTCYAELSTFCLQSNRYSPARGTRYEIAGGGVRLLGMDDAGHDGMDLISDIVEIYDNYDFGTEVLVASVRSVNHVKDAAKLGADVCTLPPGVLRQLISHPLTDKGLAAFLADWEKTGQSILDAESRG